MMAILRNLAISMLRLAKYDHIAAATWEMAAKSHKALRLNGLFFIYHFKPIGGLQNEPGKRREVSHYS